MGRLCLIVLKNCALCDKSMKYGTHIAKDRPKKLDKSGHHEFTICQPGEPFFKKINLSIVAITSCGMSCGAEPGSNRAFVSSGKTAHTAHAVFFPMSSKA